MVHDLFTVHDDGTITLEVHAQPGAGRSAVVGRHGDALKVRVGAPPEGGRANAALVKLLAGELGVEEGAVTLVAGEHNRAKRFRITGADADEFGRRVEQLVAGATDAPGRAPKDGRRP